MWTCIVVFGSLEVSGELVAVAPLDYAPQFGLDSVAYTNREQLLVAVVGIAVVVVVAAVDAVVVAAGDSAVNKKEMRKKRK